MVTDIQALQAEAESISAQIDKHKRIRPYEGSMAYREWADDLHQLKRARTDAWHKIACARARPSSLDKRPV